MLRNSLLQYDQGVVLLNTLLLFFQQVSDYLFIVLQDT